MPTPATPAHHVCALLLAANLWFPASGGPALADDPRPQHVDAARELAEEVAAGAAGETLDAWSRSVIEQALQRAGAAAGVTAAPPEGETLPHERHAAAPERPASPEVLLFTSLAVPAASWRSAARDAGRIGAPLVLRGVAAGSLAGTARQVRARLGDANAGVAIDPRLFRLFGIARVPAVVVVPGGVPPCRSRGCADDAPPPFDRVSGNLSLAAALEAVAAEGDAGPAVARRHLAILRGIER
ncbi:MAG: type-F conjugative transfer system pilin assembly protein TrbC [Rhodospirillales bacterium]|nr:type-F conjugative transfer system pilin assembly protein TrbC [Rhodospirillales bacterium]